MGKIIRPYATPAPAVRDSHVIPRFYLNKFADDAKRLFVYRKNLPPKQKSTKSQCVERDYFEYEWGNERSSNKYELLLSRLESSAAKVYPKVVAAKQLSQDDVTVWALFIATLFMRTRKIRDRLSSGFAEVRDQGFLQSSNLTSMQHDLFKNGQLYSTEEIARAVQRTSQKMEENPAFMQFSNLEERAANYATIIGAKAWHTLRPAEGRYFATSDCPVFTLKQNKSGHVFPGYGFAKDDVSIFLPLAPDAIFVASPLSMNWMRCLDDISTDTINKAVVQYASECVFSSAKSDALKRLVDEEVNQVRFGINAYVAPDSHAQS